MNEFEVRIQYAKQLKNLLTDQYNTGNKKVILKIEAVQIFDKLDFSY